MNYGSIRYAQGHWLIQCEPHIRAHLKRVFARVDKGARACAQLTDTPENSRNLLWFIDRYPMTVDRLDYLRRLAADFLHGLGIAAPGSTTNVTALPLAPREPITEETTP